MTSWATNPAKLRQYAMLLADAVVFVLALSSAVLLRAQLSGQSPGEIVARMGFTWPVVLMTIYLLSLFVFNLYDLSEPFRSVRGLVTITLAVLCASIVGASLLFFVVGPRGSRFVIGRTIFLVQAPLVLLGAFLWRHFFFNSLLFVSRRRRLALVGLDRSFDMFWAGLAWFPVKEFDFVGVLSEDGQVPEQWAQPDLIIPLNGRSLEDVVEEQAIDTLVCSINSGVTDDLMRQALALREKGIEVRDLPSFYSRLLGKIPVFSVNTSWVLQTIGHAQPRGLLANLQRFLEIIGASFLLLLCGPLLLLIVVAIKLDSRGPLLFRQERLGLQGRPFYVNKFRTMIEDAELVTGPVWAEADDPRVTRVGRILRKTRFDELPQLINVLKGQMGFVGFRPIRRYFADILSQEIPFYSLRFSIRPGLTGWPQVQHDYSASVDGQKEKFEYELFYLANRSPMLDLFILLKTVQTVLFGRGQ